MRSSKSCTRWETPAGEHEVMISCDQKGQITGMKHCLDGLERTKESIFEQSRQHPHASQVKRQIKRTRIVKEDGTTAPKSFIALRGPKTKDYSSGLYRFWLRILVIVNMCTRSCLNTARIASSQRIWRRSLGSCSSFSRIYCQTFLTV